MNLIADESVEAQIVNKLRQSGHTVESIQESCPGTDDDVILAHANSQGILLLTSDKDFGELVFLHQQQTAGVVLIRLAGLPNDVKADIVSTAFESHGKEFTGNFSVITASSIRIRKRIL